MKLLERLPFEANVAPIGSIHSQKSFISEPGAPMVSDMLKTLRTNTLQSRKRLTDEGAERIGKHRLDQLDPSRVAKHLVMFRPTEQDVVDVVAKARLTIPTLAATENVLKVARYNPICILGLS